MKKFIAMLLAMVMCVSMAACGGSSSEPTDSSTTETTTEETSKNTDAVEVALGEPITTDFMEMTFNDVTIAADIKHEVKTGNVTRITGPDPVSGQQYICLSGTIKNISTAALPVFDFFAGNFKFDDYNYEVSANDCDVLNGEGSSEMEIDPLMEYNFRIYKAIPDSLAESHSACTFTFGFFDLFENEGFYSSSEDDKIALCPYQYSVTIK